MLRRRKEERKTTKEEEENWEGWMSGVWRQAESIENGLAIEEK